MTAVIVKKGPAVAGHGSALQSDCGGFSAGGKL